MDEWPTATETEIDVEGGDLRPFYFYVVFWGEKFRDYFLDFCLPSLLAPNNIPVLGGPDHCHLLIATTKEDWAVVKTAPIFPLLERWAKPVWLEMARPDPEASPMRAMSEGQKAAVCLAYDDGAYATALAPDLVLSDGSVAELKRLALAGKRLVLVPALRFSMDPIVAAFRDRGWLRSGEPLILPSRELMEVSLPNLHSEILRFEWDAPYFAEFPISCYWRVPDGSGIALHTFSWAPMLLDYGSLKVHRAETLDDWTLDGDYVYQNFPDMTPRDETFHIVTDSDAVGFVSMTSESDLTFHPLRGHWAKSLPVLGEWTKGYFLNKAFHNPVFDPLKRQIFGTPIRMHSKDTGEVWKSVENRARTILFRYIDAPELAVPDGANPRASIIQYYPVRISIPIFLLRFSVGFWRTRIVFRACMGNAEARSRIANKRSRVVAEHGSLAAYAWAIVRDRARRLRRRFSGQPDRQYQEPAAAPSTTAKITSHWQPIGALSLPFINVNMLTRFGQKIWNVLVCIPEAWLVWLRPYLRVIYRAARGNRDDQRRIKRRIGLVLQVGRKGRR